MKKTFNADNRTVTFTELLHRADLILFNNRVAKNRKSPLVVNNEATTELFEAKKDKDFESIYEVNYHEKDNALTIIKREVPKFFISLARAQGLEDSIGWLSSYKTPSNEVHHMGPDINTVDEAETKLLKELGELNKRREEIIQHLVNLKP